MLKLKIVFASVLLASVVSCSTQNTTNNPTDYSPQGRAEYEFEKIKDPATGEIPTNIRMRELAFASTLPKSIERNSRASLQIFQPIGPRNVGGRTRAISFHVDKPNVLLAGGVSGGMWRSTDRGGSWKRATNFEDQSAVSCMVQDLRTGKTNTFYYGGGEIDGNSATKSFSAVYLGSGVYKSTDDGETWSLLPSTAGEPHKGGDWSTVLNLSIENSRSDSDIVFAATGKGIQRSNNGGTTWTNVLPGSTSKYANIATSSTGIHYAAISEGGNDGFYRSSNGFDWVNISPNDLPGNHGRTLMAISPSNENIIYFYTDTDGTGVNDASLWKYTYLSGNGTGSGGVWENKTSNLPAPGSWFGQTLDTFGGYCMSLAVKPDNSNIVFVGGTNLYRLNLSNNTESQIGGYEMDNGSFPEGAQHADQQTLAFDPLNANHMLAGTDGGVHYTNNCTATNVPWESFNNGYQTTQFYGLGIDHVAQNEHVISGYQDNGSWWAGNADTNFMWIKANGGDGAYCAKEGGTDRYYVSSQNGNIRTRTIDSNGNLGGTSGINRPSNSGYLFNHPFILNPANEKQMYLPVSGQLYRTLNLSGGATQWDQIGIVSDQITALAASKSQNGIVYVGTDSRRIYRIEDNGSPTATVTEVTNNISTGSYTSSIAVHPKDPDKVLVVYSNYNVVSGWYSENGGQTWTNVEGNLKGDPDPGVPPQFDYIGNGPSFRWARFIPTNDGDVVMVGTSIGLFATNDLNATEVEWVQQASDVIGNVVIEQIDSRDSDGFCVIATHGAGAYKTYFQNSTDITSMENVVVNPFEVKAFPNPVIHTLNFEFSLMEPETVQINVIGSNGATLINTVYIGKTGNNTTQLNLNSIPAGIYYIQLVSKKGKHIESIIKN